MGAGVKAGLAVLVPCTPAVGNTETLACSFSVPAQSNVLATTLTVRVDRDNDAVKIDDPTMAGYSSVPMNARIQTANAARTTYVWKTPVIQKTGWSRADTLTYSLTVMNGSNAAVLFAQPSSVSTFGYGMAGLTFRAEGMCHAAN